MAAEEDIFTIYSGTDSTRQSCDCGGGVWGFDMPSTGWFTVCIQFSDLPDWEDRSYSWSGSAAAATFIFSINRLFGIAVYLAYSVIHLRLDLHCISTVPVVGFRSALLCRLFCIN